MMIGLVTGGEGDGEGKGQHPMGPTINQSEIVFMRFSTDTRPCNTVEGRDHKEGIADIFLNVVDFGINIVQTLTNSQFIDDIAKDVFKT